MQLAGWGIALQLVTYHATTKLTSMPTLYSATQSDSGVLPLARKDSDTESANGPTTPGLPSFETPHDFVHSLTLEEELCIMACKFRSCLPYGRYELRGVPVIGKIKILVSSLLTTL